MSKEFTRKAVELLLKGASLISDPCPYCKGVRIIKDGNAFCVNCGKEGTNQVQAEMPEKQKGEISSVDKLDEKLKELTEQLQKEKDFEKQKEILHSINEIMSIKERIRRL